MPAVKGIGFDLFGTLVLQERFSFEQCIDALHGSLVTSGFALEKGPFLQVYREVNRRLMDQATADGRETHNRLWVAGALEASGHTVAPTDACIEAAVNAYFEPFVQSCQLWVELGQINVRGHKVRCLCVAILEPVFVNVVRRVVDGVVVGPLPIQRMIGLDDDAKHG